KTRTPPFGFTHFGADSRPDKFLPQLLGALQNAPFLVVRLINRHDDQLKRGQPRRENQSLVVAMHHNNRPDKTGGKPPRSSPAMLLHSILIQIANLKGFGEILA